MCVSPRSVHPMATLSPPCRGDPRARKRPQKHSPLNAASIIEQHSNLLIGGPRSKPKQLLEEVSSLAAFCDEAACKELIVLTAELVENMKEQKSYVYKRNSRQTKILEEFENFVSKLRERADCHEKRAQKQLALAQQLQSKGELKVGTEVGPVPNKAVSRGGGIEEAKRILRLQLGKRNRE